MHSVLTATLKLYTTPAQLRAAPRGSRKTQLAYRDALNAVSQYAFAHGQLSQPRALQAATYRDVRERFGLPAQLACNVPRQVRTTYQALWTKVRANAAARAAGVTKRRSRGLDQPPKSGSPTLTSNYRRDLQPQGGAAGEPADALRPGGAALQRLHAPCGPAAARRAHRRRQAAGMTSPTSGSTCW
jgi:hypothetical protein